MRDSETTNAFFCLSIVVFRSSFTQRLPYVIIILYRRRWTRTKQARTIIGFRRESVRSDGRGCDDSFGDGKFDRPYPPRANRRFLLAASSLHDFRRRRDGIFSIRLFGGLVLPVANRNREIRYGGTTRGFQFV